MKKQSMYLISALAFAACGEDEPGNGNGNGNGDTETETISNVNLTFTPAGGGTPVTAEWSDLDGVGGAAPTATAIVLEQQTTYTMSVELLDSTDPADVEDITEEIQEEAEEHQFFFEGTAVESDTFTGTNILVEVSYADVESDWQDDATAPDLPVGLEVQVDTLSTPGTEDQGFVVRLQHQPPENGNIVKTANSDRNTGDTDVQAIFPLTVN